MPQKWGFDTPFLERILALENYPLTICGKNKVLITPFQANFSLRHYSTKKVGNSVGKPSVNCR